MILYLLVGGNGLSCAMMHTDDRRHLARMAGFFHEMTSEQVGQVKTLYAVDAAFNDPINEVVGAEAIEKVMADLFKQLKHVTIAVKDMHGDDRSGFLQWNMHYEFRGKKRSIPGVSHFRFNQAGLVTQQEDFWDASFVLYGEFPILGAMMRGIRKMVRVKV